VTRAVRTPSRIDRDFYIPGSPPYYLAGGPDFVSEKLIAYEAGYRLRKGALFSLELSTFYNVYDDLRSIEPGPPLVIANGLEGNTYGAEAQVGYEPARWWQWRVGYAYLGKDIRVKPGSRDVNNGTAEGDDPKHRVSVQTFLQVTEKVEVDVWFRLVDRLPDYVPNVPGYATLDLQLGWEALPDLRISAVGQNLLDKQHPEFGPPAGRSEIQRGAFLKAVWAY
jgi:iron complex outermembrane receptor protein